MGTIFRVGYITIGQDLKKINFTCKKVYEEQKEEK